MDDGVFIMMFLAAIIATAATGYFLGMDLAYQNISLHCEQFKMMSVDDVIYDCIARN